MTRQSTSAEGNSIDKDQTPVQKTFSLSRQLLHPLLYYSPSPIPPPRSGTCMHYTPESGWPFCLLANRCNLRNWHSKDSQYPDEAQPQQLNDSPIWTWTLLRWLGVCAGVCEWECESKWRQHNLSHDNVKSANCSRGRVCCTAGQCVRGQRVVTAGSGVSCACAN